MLAKVNNFNIERSEQYQQCWSGRMILIIGDLAFTIFILAYFVYLPGFSRVHCCGSYMSESVHY